MSMHSVRYLPTCLCLGVLWCASYCWGAITFLGPTPYLSPADSPFAEHLDKPGFYLEDFEDGELNTPGIFQPLAPLSHGIIRLPGSDTNSVDGDDGLVDGNGEAGHSIVSNFYTTQFVDPQRSQSYLRFAFDEQILGALPTKIGLVWTNGIEDTRLTIELFDEKSQTLAVSGAFELGSGTSLGVSNDRFVGVVSSIPFAMVEIIAYYSGPPTTMEIDHVQYFAEVPEPPSLEFVILSLATVYLHRPFAHALGRRVSKPEA